MVDVLKLSDVAVRRDGRNILDHLTWDVAGDQRWVVLGPNGAGKTTLLRVADASFHPTSGAVEVLGSQLGRTDVFELRPRVGMASSALAREIPPSEAVRDVILTAAHSVTGRWRESYDDIDEARADEILGQWNLTHLAERSYGSLSDGEQKRVQIARAVMTDPELLLLDEPTASLDLGAREELLALLGEYTRQPQAPAMVMVTHHVEEIPPGFTHVLLLRDGKQIAAGPIAETLTPEALTQTFGVPIALAQAGGRYAARAVRR